MTKKYRTVSISDIHLGMNKCLHKELLDYLNNNDISCQTLILNGDIIDLYALARGKKWKKTHTKILEFFMKMSENDTEVIYIIGNHDITLEHFVNFNFGKIKILRKMIYNGFNKKFLVIHGDLFDNNCPSWLYRLGDIGYNLILFINYYYNKWRMKKGLDYWPLSQRVKSNVKILMNWVNKFEKHLVNAAKGMKVDGVICGHIHKPEIRYIDNILYLNSGDWVETGSFLVEHWNGEWEIKTYK